VHALGRLLYAVLSDHPSGAFKRDVLDPDDVAKALRRLDLPEGIPELVAEMVGDRPPSAREVLDRLAPPPQPWWRRGRPPRVAAAQNTLP
jgi:hypothetical protein